VVQNAVEHGSRSDGTETIEISCALSAAAVEIEVVDPGTGKGPQALLSRDVTAAPPADAPRGRGLYLIHRMVREFDRRLDPRGGSFIRVRLCAGMPVP
jgi:anti-sigma regulatory factor (Ser/Thr protein kinase)